MGGIATSRIYMRYERIEEKRAALDNWRLHLERIVHAKERSTVIAFRN